MTIRLGLASLTSNKHDNCAGLQVAGEDGNMDGLSDLQIVVRRYRCKSLDGQDGTGFRGGNSSAGEEWLNREPRSCTDCEVDFENRAAMARGEATLNTTCGEEISMRSQNATCSVTLHSMMEHALQKQHEVEGNMRPPACTYWFNRPHVRAIAAKRRRRKGPSTGVCDRFTVSTIPLFSVGRS